MLSEASLHSVRETSLNGLDELQAKLRELMSEGPAAESKPRKIDVLVQERLPKKLDLFSTLRELVLLGKSAFNGQSLI